MSQDCINKLMKSFTDIDPKKIAEIVQALDKLKGEKGFGSLANSFRERTTQELQMAAEFKARQIIARKRVDQFIETPEFKENPNDAFKAKSFGVDHLTKGGNDSFNATKESIRGQHLNLLDRGLKDHMSIVADGKSDVAIAEAIESLNNSKSISRFPEHIRDVATAIKNVNTSLIKTMQDVGVIIKERADFITRQTHNREKIAAIPVKEWIAEIDGRLNHEKTFGSLPEGQDKTSILKGIYNDIVSGDAENNIGSFGGKRVLHFKSGKDWALYNTKFGHGTLVDTTVLSINSAAKVGGATRVLGPDPRAIWDHMETRIASKMDDARKAKFMDTTLGGEKRQRDNWSKEMFGYERHPGREMVATFQRNVNLLVSASKLGLSLPTTFTDLAFSTTNFRAATGAKGFSEIEAIGNFLKVFTNTKDRNDWANTTDMYFGDLQSSVFDRYGGFEGGGRNGLFQRIAKKAITLTGLERQSSAAKTANARLFSVELGRNVKKNFNDINPRLKAGMERFNITEKDWEILRQSTQEFKPGVFGVTGEGVRQAEVSLTSAQRTDLAIKVSNYLGDMARIGSPEASGLERSVITQGFSPDDPMGAFLRMTGQFKSFALAVPRVLRRISLSNPELKGRKLADNFRGQGDLGFLALAMTEATLLAGAGILTKDVLKGKKPREIDGKFLLEASLSGAAPLAITYTMDALRGEYDKFGRSIFKDLVGPSVGQIDDVIRVLSGAIRMDSKAGIKATKLIMNNLPGVNLPFIKPMVNKLFMTDLFDSFNPGYEARLRQRANREGTEFLFNPF